MAKIMTDSKHYTDIATAIREKTGSTAQMKPAEMAGQIGGIKSYAEGYEAGQTAEYDRFWDALQENGQRKNYDYTFYRWTAENFKPKYPIRPTDGGATWLLCYSTVTDRRYLDLIDFSQSYNVTSPFDSTIMPTFGVVDLSSVGSGKTVTNLFRYNSKIHTIEKIVVHEGIKYSQWFSGDSSLANVTFEGVIGQDGLNFNWSPLSTESMKNIILHLKNLIGTANEHAFTIKFSDACWAALDAEGNTAPGGVTWKSYVDSLGWNR